MDPFIAILSWLCLRGSDSWYLFCNLKSTKSGSLLEHGTTFSVSRFTTLLRCRLCDIGIGQADVSAYSGHSLKRGAVQLYRSLGYKDEFIMELVKSSEFTSYVNYCEVYNDCNSSLPRFSSMNSFLSHAFTLAEDQMGTNDGDMEFGVPK